MYETKQYPTVVITPRRDEAEKNLYIRENTAQYIASAELFPLISALDADSGYIEALCASVSGIVFEGGGDILPRFYGQTGEQDCFGVDPLRDEFELALFRAAYLHGIPILGICRGAQIIAIGTGGTLIRHTEGHSDGILHRINIAAGSRFCNRGTAEAVNSYHHQAVGTVPSRLFVSARSSDGTAEAVEATEHPFCVGVQWHPELTPQSTLSHALISAFARAVREYDAKRLVWNQS